ncbi:MAG: penicillin acylase family protein, partial [Gemmatimonadota bacterium]
MKLMPLAAVAALGLASFSIHAETAAAPPALRAWQQRAEGVTIVRDDWGIPHISADTDADAIFGMLYAQAEDDFNRIETNFINAMGRLAETEGEAEIYRDLRMKLFIDPEELKARYRQAPGWLQRNMDAWADGLNFYLATHPEVRPRVIKTFEPWMALSFSEGSIGGDIERVSIDGLKAFYGKVPVDEAAAARGVEALAEPTGSNGFAIAPSNSASGKAMLFINPHTSFFFRHEAQVSSREGLNVYGASTWGQFFVYQGFNERLGWMHTSSGVDNIDEYALTTHIQPDGIHYRFGSGERRLRTKTITVPYSTAGGMASKVFTVYYSHHGPVVREADGKWIAVRLMNSPLDALTQSYARTRARNMKEFKEILALHTNSSNNTVYADADGNIAYWHANFVPRRDTRFDWSKPVDGSDPRTDWGAPHTVDESPNNINPANGWLQNTNNWPWSSSAGESPTAGDFARYFDYYTENPRGLHAIRVLSGARGLDKDALIRLAFDSYQPAFAQLLPGLIASWDALPASSPQKGKLKAPVLALRGWDYRWAVDSVPNSVAIFWAEDLWRRIHANADSEDIALYEDLARAPAAQKLAALEAAVDRLVADFGRWDTPWGEINRFQRISPAIVHPFDDAMPSIPVAFPSAQWGSLASFGAQATPQTRKRYGTSGNSFVAAVEFGDRVSARAVTAGGLSSDVNSTHFNDQAERYATGNLREVYFYPEQLEAHTERRYTPGQR